MLYELPSFDHIDAKSIEEALSVLHNYRGEAKVIAGGTDLLSLMKDRIEGPELHLPKVLINIKTIPEIDLITGDENGGLRIGAAVTLNRLEKSDVIRQKFTVLWQAARQVGTTQIRNMGTIGGNIFQRPRCLYFRHPDFPCYKKGGSTCYAVTGEHRYDHSILKKGKCVVAHPSDMAPALVAVNAKAILASLAGEKEIPIQDLFVGPNNFTETVLKPDELLKEIQVPNQDASTYQTFLKHRIRHSSDFSLASVAAVATVSDDIWEDVRLVLGGIAPYPYRASGAEKVVRGKRLNEAVISEAVKASLKGARPLRMNSYKIDLTEALVRRVLTAI